MPFVGKRDLVNKHVLSTQQPLYNQKCWRQCSPDALALVQGMLQKNAEYRMTIDDVLDSPWLNNLELRDELDKKKKPVYIKRKLLC